MNGFEDIPAELEQRDQKLRDVLDGVLADLTFWVVAVELGECPNVIDRWRQAPYDRLDRLDFEELTRAVVLLLGDHGLHHAMAAKVLGTVRKGRG